MLFKLEKAGTNEDQCPNALIHGPYVGNEAAIDSMRVGEVFHVAGQPDDVLWRIIEIVSE